MIFILFALISLLVYIFMKHLYSYWERRNVPYAKPSMFFGNIQDVILGKKHIADIVEEYYKEFKDLPFFGIYRGFSPVLIIKDPDFIKQVLVKDFQYFTDNDFHVSKKNDPLFGRNPFVLKGEEWKQTRTLLTPCFTGQKMKTIYPMIHTVSEQLVDYINRSFGSNQKALHDIKDLFTRYTLENIAITAFGVNSKCFVEENPEFRRLANHFMTPSGWNVFRMTLLMMYPTLSSFLSFAFVEKAVNEKLVEITGQSVDYRKRNDKERKDFLEMLLNIKENNDDNFTDIDIAAHAAGFFIDGYETSSTSATFVCYELAMNPEIQSRARDEIVYSIAENYGELSFDALSKMEYLEAILYESLRMYPVLRAVFKMCTKPYTYTTEGNYGLKKMTINVEKDTAIIIPSHGLAMDTRFHDKPDVFNPDRFLGDNKNNLNKYAMTLFGEGPRQCLGRRFGLLQMKLGLAQILRNFEMRLNPKTITPIQFEPVHVLGYPKGGVHIDFYKLDRNS